MISHYLHAPVSALMRHVADTVIMPRFRTLAEHEIREKTPGEVVTIADREAEERLAEGLLAIEPARLIGEEAAASDPALLDGLGVGRLWLVDPLDGTANFAAGKTPFGLMVSLVQDGEVEAGWLYDPVNDRMCHAHRGHGASIDGDSIGSRSTGRRRPVAALATWIMDAQERAEVEARAATAFQLVPIPRCAAEHYPRLCLGQYDISLFRRTLPWDHAPGSLFLSEAGGSVTRMDGSPYRVGDGKSGLLAASNHAMWKEAMRVLVDQDQR